MAAVASNMLQVEKYKNELKTKAEALILRGFPEKIVKLNNLLATDQFNEKDMNSVHESLNIPVPEPIAFNCHSPAEGDTNGGGTERGGKKRKLENCVDGEEPKQAGTKVMALLSGPVPCNKRLTDLIAVVKPQIKELVEDSNLLKMWISFMIPKIEDGNNFGVSVQEDTLAEVQSVESEAATYFDQITRYYASRAKVLSKVAKYPHIDDYRIAVRELDEKQYLSVWLVLCEIRNRYCTLHDIITKNLEKLKKPRSSNTDALY
ncbi:proteasome activator complex subunit 3 isoform X2 [Nilaparvata lugens]|uniref:proteasome activator complex subunit 3 isoform X1 n=1 Tax=Nilaparvata lugens TaxID=108931 RepID=UPI00193CFD47|nr:proteasome activator complex subunit 3 isoform X1 [Nilaparvata lugens]XP_039296969.1 proteasome activator complex subunit 3 isoform X2 [Nilaparvata lugens]